MERPPPTDAPLPCSPAYLRAVRWGGALEAVGLALVAPERLQKGYCRDAAIPMTCRSFCGASARTLLAMCIRAISFFLTLAWYSQNMTSELKHINCNTRPIKRSAGHSAVAGAAYRAGVALYDERREQRQNYTGRSPDVRESIILAPDDAPDWVFDREALWNAAEAAEKRKDGRPARDVRLGLAWELNVDDQREAVTTWVKREFTDKGHVCDISFHRYGSLNRGITDAEKETLRQWAGHNLPYLESEETNDLNEPHVKIERAKNGDLRGYKIYQPHAHALVTPRALDDDGFAAKRNREFDHPSTEMNWRYEWPQHQNDYLEKAGATVRVTATSDLEDARIDAKPEGLGQVAHHVEQRGEEYRRTDDVERNKHHNDVLRKVVADMPQSESEELTRRERLMHWWGNFRDRLPEHKEALREKAAHYVRFLGGRLRPDKDEQIEEPEETPSISIHSAQLDEPNHGHHWPKRGDHEPDPSA